jgi:hypothetical protein
MTSENANSHQNSPCGITQLQTQTSSQHLSDVTIYIGDLFTISDYWLEYILLFPLFAFVYFLTRFEVAVIVNHDARLISY